MRAATVLLAGWGLLLAGAAGRAADAAASPPSPKELDRTVYATVSAVMNEAAALYNAGNPTASAYLFRGALMSLDPLLNHRPELQKAIRQGLAEAQRLPEIDRRAWALHYVAARVQTDVRPGMPVTGEGRTVWERLGGEENVTRIVDDFVESALQDPKVNFTRNGRFPLDRERKAQLKRQIVLLASAVGGGPHRYGGRSMKQAHKGIGITDDEFDALVPHLRIALLKHQVKAPDVLAITEMIQTVRGDVVESTPTPGGAPRSFSLWDRLGGEANVTKIASDFVDAAVQDPKVNFSRNHRYPVTEVQKAQLKKQIVSLASAVGGGPYKYHGPTMKQLHKGMGITDDEFDALLAQLKMALLRNGVKELDIQLTLKAIEVTRKDVVEGRRGAMGATPDEALPVPPPPGFRIRGAIPAPAERMTAAPGNGVTPPVSAPPGADRRPAPAVGESPGGWLMSQLARVLREAEPGGRHAP